MYWHAAACEHHAAPLFHMAVTPGAENVWKMWILRYVGEQQRFPFRAAGDQAPVCLLQFLCHMPALKALDLAYCSGADDWTMQLIAENLPFLELLVLLHCRSISDRGLYTVCCLSDTLKDVYLDGCTNISEAGMQAAIWEANSSLNLIRFGL